MSIRSHCIAVAAQIIFLLSLTAATSFAADDSTNDASAGTPETDKYRTAEMNAFINEMSTATGWTVTWSKTGKDCSKKKYTDDNNSWVDASDIHFHSGHGGDRWDWGYMATKRAIIFKDTQIVPSEAQSNNHGIWGNNDLEWIGFSCCSLLDDKSYKCWAASMDKLHLFLGYKTTHYSYDTGWSAKTWAKEMKKKATITQAWFTSTDVTQPAGVVARVLAEQSVNFDDHLNNYGTVSADPSPDKTFYYRDHKSGSPPYLTIDPPLSNMRVYEVQGRTVNTAYVNQLAAAFDITANIQEDNDCFFIATAGTAPCVLNVYKASGLYYYYNTARLWNTNYDLSYPIFPLGTAYSQAENFYAARPVLYREGRGAFEVENDNYVVIDNDVEIENRPVTCTVYYARQIEADAGRMASIAGPGAKTKLYLAHDGTVMGGVGNWRPVQWNGAIVPVLDKSTAWNLFVEHGMQMTISPLTLAYDYAATDLNTATQAYYEAPGGETQTQLLPVWIFKVDYYQDNQVVLAAADTFVYAAPTMAPPVAVIDSPTDGSSISSRTPPELQGNVVAGFGIAPYQYHWESDIDGPLCDGQICTPPTGLSFTCVWDTNAGYKPAAHRISLTVTDALGRSNTDTVTVYVSGAYCQADIDHSGRVDLADFAMLAQSWLVNLNYAE